MNANLGTLFPGLVRYGICAAISFGVLTQTALAHDDPSHYDNSKLPYESPHKAEPPTGGHNNLASAATNPIANLVQFQLQNQYNWDNANSNGYSNAFLIQPVVPVKLPSKKVPLMITRTTVPYVSTPNLGTPDHRKHGVGDTTVLALGLPKLPLEKQMVGIGPSLVIPTAGDDDFTGSGKWQAGPAFVYINLQTKGLQWGALGWHHWSYASTSGNREDVSESSIQPFITKHFAKGWYAGTQDIPWNYNYKSENWTTPFGPKLGRVFKMGAQPVNLFGAVYYDPNDDGPSAKWTAKINLTLLFPE